MQRLLDLAGLRYTTSEKSGPSWQSMLHNFLSRPLSFLGWTTAMLFWLVFHQTQSNLYKWFRMQRHDWSSTSPKEPMLHLSSSHCTGYQWQLATSSRHWCLHTERPQAQHPPTSTHYYESTSPPEVWDLLVSDALWYHHREAQNHSPEHSHSPFLDGGIIFPPLSGMLDPCQSSSNNWKLISFGTTWLHPKLVLKKNIYIFLSSTLYLSLLPLQACTCSVWLPLQDQSLYVFPNCKLLWIKVSAKWLNVNVNVNVNELLYFYALLKIVSQSQIFSTRKCVCLELWSIRKCPGTEESGTLWEWELNKCRKCVSGSWGFRLNASHRASETAINFMTAIHKHWKHNIHTINQCSVPQHILISF